MDYILHEIFETLQGEGCQTGRPAVFIRFSGCNLACPWCDTDFSPQYRLSLETLLEKVATFTAKSVILTGGEPLLQPNLLALTQALKSRGYWIGIETNATIEPSTELRQTLDYIATSPKKALVIRKANEVRLVVTEASEAMINWCHEVRAAITADDYYLSPCDDHGTLKLKETLTLLGQLNATQPLPPWRLSLQTHKLAGIP